MRSRPRPSPNPKRPERFVVGIHAVREVLKVRPRDVGRLWLRQGYADHRDLAELEGIARSLKIPVDEKSPGQLSQIAETHQGVAISVSSRPLFDWDELTAPTQRLILLDQVEDPHNLGAIMRTGWLMGASGVFVPEQRAAGLSPSASKVAQGATEHLPLIEENLNATIDDAKERGFWIFGLSHRASKSLYSLEFPEKVAWVLGSEASGLRKATEKACDELVSIPQIDASASYNVSVALAIALSETFRQHQIAEKSGK